MQQLSVRLWQHNASMICNYLEGDVNFQGWNIPVQNVYNKINIYDGMLTVISDNSLNVFGYVNGIPDQPSRGKPSLEPPDHSARKVHNSSLDQNSTKMILEIAFQANQHLRSGMLALNSDQFSSNWLC